MVNDNIIDLYLLNLAFAINNEKIMDYINNINCEITQEDEDFIIDLFNNDEENSGE